METSILNQYTKLNLQYSYILHAVARFHVPHAILSSLRSSVMERLNALHVVVRASLV